jgi:guanylate kinase
MNKLPSSALGCLFVLAAPSGAGKTSLVNELLSRDPSIKLSVSYTTRSPRPAEEHGVHYHFVDVDTFNTLKNRGEFLEDACVYGNYYATSKTWLKTQLEAGLDVLLEIDWQGAAQVREAFPESAQIFVLPPSLDALEHRLNKRGQDSPEVIQKRLEMVREEFRHYVDFDYVIINENFSDATDDLLSIVRSERLRATRQRIRHASLLKQLTE